MKILNKYIVKSFLTGYAIAFCVLIGLIIIIDLFINLDEFFELSHLGTWVVIRNIIVYYAINTAVYFRDIAGMITVVAAAFSLAKMVRSNELVAMMSSGVSLKRIVVPVLILAAIFTGVMIIDQELIIPSLSDKLVLRRNTEPGQELYNIWFITDSNGSLICAQKYEVDTATLYYPTIITRRQTERPDIWMVTGKISADRAVYNKKTKKWDLENGIYYKVSPIQEIEGRTPYEPEDDLPTAIEQYDSVSLTPHDIPIMQKGEFKAFLSSRQLAVLAAQGTRVKDVAQLYSQKHFRITDPIINFTMLMVSLPVLVCRDPKAMKSAVLLSFVLTVLCFIMTFSCKLLATEVVFDRVMPEIWAWLPVFVFVPIAFIELDAMKT
jgi:lipopolysaccharide export system permease protein